MPPWLGYPLTVGTLAAAFLFYRRGDPVAAVTIVVIAISGWTGFRMGLGRITATVVALAAAIAFAPSLGMRFESQFANRFGTTGLTNRFLCIASIGVLISLALTLVMNLITHRILLKRRKLSFANSLAGFAVGIAEGAAMALLVLGGLLSMQLWQRNEDIANNSTAKAVDEWASRTRQSVIGSVVRDYNPFERISFLSGVDEARLTAGRLKDPRNVQRLLENPRIARLRSDPAVVSAIEDIRRDPKIQDLINHKQPMDRQTIMHLMSSPSVMRLLDNPEFVEQARKAVQELD
ncbi:MAG: CvpA family protein [Planctomycetales bacterium]|nr:CvpA family protein [Planctomycetales bacterium]